MKEEEKYYTPGREEFCWGFEYESEEDPVRGLWEKQIVGAWSQFKYFDDDSDVAYRVKYLDKKDIESLGFKGQEVNTVYFKRDGWRLVHWFNEPIRITSIYKVYSDKDEVKVFDGTIKNKSELKKLLQMLNIE